MLLRTISLVFTLASIATAQTWTQLSPTGATPLGRFAHSAVYNAATNRMVVFGGFHYGISLPPGTEFTNDVWVLTNANNLGGTPAWIELIPAGAPGSPRGRHAHSAVYDLASNRMIVFGGQLPQTGEVLNDVWVLINADGTTGSAYWTQLSPAGTPPVPRQYQGAVYDAATNRMIVFGGGTTSGGSCPDPMLINDVWVLTNANGTESTTPTWTQLSPAGTPPAPRIGSAITYDSVNNRMIIFGGAGGNSLLNDTWVLTNANGLGGTPTWLQLSPSGTPPSRRFVNGIYDLGSNRLVIFGGNLQSCEPGYGAPTYVINDSWVLTNANGLAGTPTWQQLLPSNTPPSGRRHHSSVYDQAGKRMVIFGGQAVGGGVAQNDTWVLTNAVGDSTPPTTTDNSPSTWQKADFTVSLTCTDNAGGSGCKETKYRIDGGAWQIGSSVSISTDGDHVIEYYSIDNAGNQEVVKSVHGKLDKAPPTVTFTAPTTGSEYILNGNVLANWSATDAVSGLASATGTVPSGSAIDTSTVGEKTFTVVATDNAGNQTTQTETYYVRYVFDGILQPINSDGTSLFRLGSTVPVKFQLQDANGNFVSTAIANIYLVKMTDSVPAGSEVEAVSTSAATSGNLFRYDSASNQYIFNLWTKTLSKGYWRIRILLDDGTSKYVFISLR